MSPASADDDVRRIESAILALFRRGNHPRFHDQLNELAGRDLERAGYIVLGRIADFGPLRLRELADNLGVDTSTASRQVTRLIDDGHVEREPDPTDGRAHLLSVSSGGRRVLEQRRAAWRVTLERFLEDWDPRRIAAFADSLERFVCALEDFVERGAPARAEDDDDTAASP